MFSKSNKETKEQGKLESQDFPAPSKEEMPTSSYSKPPIGTDNEELIEVETEQPTTVSIVEKISAILSPYFIVLVGLYLYDDNFLFGTVLILIGIISLLKISYQDLVKWFEYLKKFLGYDSSND